MDKYVYRLPQRSLTVDFTLRLYFWVFVRFSC